MSGKKPQPRKPAVWNHATREERLRACRLMLHLHGYLSEAENAAVRRRLEKEYPNGR